MKIYLEQNVYNAFRDRINKVFDNFECVYLIFSGGKDSSVMLQLTSRIAEQRNRTFDVFYFDFEAQYKATIDHVYELKHLPGINKFWHFCLPLENEDNPTSIFRPTWIPWDEN